MWVIDIRESNRKKNADREVGIFLKQEAYFLAGAEAAGAGAAGAEAGLAAEAAGAAEAGLAAEAAEAAGAAEAGLAAEAAGAEADALEAFTSGLPWILQADRARAIMPTINRDFFICLPSKNYAINNYR